MKKWRNFLFLLLMTIGFVPPFSHDGWAEAKDPVQGGTYRRPLEFMPRTLDPAFATDIYSITIIQQVFEGLVQFDKDLNVIPAIAKSWKISHDGLTYTFTLREGVKFHSGKNVTAQDVVYSFTRIADPSTKSPAAHLLEKVLGFKEFQEGVANSIKGFRTIRRHVFEIKLSEPFTPFLSALGTFHFKVVPKDEVERASPIFSKNPVGAGPFKFVSMKEGEEILLEANANYFEGRPYLDKIVFKIFPGAPRERILKEFRDGSLEESFIPPLEIENISKEKRTLFFQKPLLSLRFYGLHTRSKPVDNKKLRKALNFAVDKKFIISHLHQNQFHLAKGILPPGMSGYDPKRDPYPYDENRAKELLAGAGYQKGQSVPLELWSATRSEAAQKELNEIKSQWDKVGIQANVNYETNWPNFESMLRANKAPAFILAWYADFPDPDNLFTNLFHSKGRINYMAYTNPEVDRLIDAARTERDYLKRMDLYRKVEEMILKDAPIVPMVNHLYQVVVQPYVRGLELNALGGPYIPMKKVWLNKEG
jgi:peptide/nickel transport system substrate-binding protein/oligopeptide transport system substrate-binding protein